jgi:hypothetical protein
LADRTVSAAVVFRPSRFSPERSRCHGSFFSSRPSRPSISGSRCWASLARTDTATCWDGRSSVMVRCRSDSGHSSVTLSTFSLTMWRERASPLRGRPGPNRVGATVLVHCERPCSAEGSPRESLRQGDLGRPRPFLLYTGALTGRVLQHLFRHPPLAVGGQNCSAQRRRPGPLGGPLSPAWSGSARFDAARRRRYTPSLGPC